MEAGPEDGPARAQRGVQDRRPRLRDGGARVRHYEVPELYERDEIESVEILRFAIRDMGIPEEAESERYQTFVEDVVDRLRHGKNAVVHCRGGLGRTGTVAASVLITLGRHSANEAIDVVRRARKGTIQTDEQEDFVRRYGESLGEGVVS